MSEGKRVARTVVDAPDAAFPEDVPASGAVAAGDFVFTSAFGATDWSTGLAADARGSEALPSGDDDPVALETREIYRKLGAALEAGGSSLDRGVQINQWVNTYRGFHGERHPANRDEVELFYEQWRSVVHPHLATRDEFLLAERPASACMPVDRFLCSEESVAVELVGVTEASGIQKRAYEHDVHMPLGGYSIGIEAGPWLFTAGFTGVDFAHGIRPESKVPDFVWYGNQIHNETAETLRQLKVTVEAGGGRLEDTVKALVYVTPFGMRNLPALDQAWRDYWPDDPPARAILPCSGVGLRGTNVEIMLTVARPDQGEIEREVIQTDSAPAQLGHAPQAVKAGGLLFCSTQLGLTADGAIGTRGANDGSFPFMRRSVKDELRAIQQNTQAICEAAGTSIDQVVKSHLFFSDFEDLAAALPVWAEAFSDGYPAAGFFETPPGAQEVRGGHVSADLIVSCPGVAMPESSEVRDGMRVDWDAPIEVDDGLVLRADVFRPDDDGEHPVILTYGPYAKGLAFQEGYPDQWRILTEEHPEVERGSSCRYQNWEVVDPEKWVPDGYACVRVDSRGTGQSPGFVDPFSARERRDFYECIEWAGTQPWSSGKVGLLGVSYYGINQWQVAADRPPHLAAICPWEGAADWYRDMTHHGGILSSFWANWYDKQVKVVQHGLGENGPRNPVTGELAAGSETLSEPELANSRTDFGEEIRAHPLDDDYHRERSADWSRVEVPMLSAANWGGQGLHPRGNFEAFANAASEQKWLEVHGLEHWTEFYTDYGIEIQKRFFGHFLKGEDTGWEEQPPVQLLARRAGGGFEQRAERAWPIPRTEWTELHLDPGEMTLAAEPLGAEAEVSYEATGDGRTFLGEPFEAETELTGPLAARLFVSSSTEDADLFLVARLFDPEGEEVVFTGALDPHTPLAQGWLRASHRELDAARSLPWRPFHTHRSSQPLTPDEVYEVEVELWPTSVIAPAGYRLGLTVRGRDYEYAGEGASLGSFKNVMRGCGPFLHDDPRDRPPEIFGGTVSIHAGPERRSRLLVPVVPREA